MANTYTHCYFHLVFALKNRDALIKNEWKGELEEYITRIVQNHRHKMLAISAMPDYITSQNKGIQRRIFGNACKEQY